METRNRLYRADRPNRFKKFLDDRGDRDDPDDCMETRLYCTIHWHKSFVSTLSCWLCHFVTEFWNAVQKEH